MRKIETGSVALCLTFCWFGIHAQFSKEVTETCGFVATAKKFLIFEGNDFERGRYPWLAAIFVNDGNILKFTCGGSLVSERYIITAAHCFYDKSGFEVDSGDVQIALGIHNRGLIGTEAGQENFRARKIVIHEKYKASNGDADIAFVVLSKKANFSPVIRPICLWPEGFGSINSLAGTNGSVAGWGKNEKGTFDTTPKEIAVPIVSYQTCYLSNPTLAVISSERTFCGGSRDNRGPCNGDSGGGFVIKREERYYLLGVVSRSLANANTLLCDLSNYVIYVDVTAFRGWIFNQVKLVEEPVELPQNICGTSSRSFDTTRNVREVSRGKYPWMGIIFNKKGQDPWKRKCETTLVSAKHTIITGKCARYYVRKGVNLADVTVVLGVHDLSKYSTENDAVQVPIKQIIIHSDYLRYNRADRANIAIVELQNTVAFTSNIRPICLWPDNLQLDGGNREAGIVAGWGGDVPDSDYTGDKIPREVSGNIVGIRDCTERNRIAFPFAKAYCAELASGDGPCEGLFSSIFMLQRGSKMYLAGIDIQNSVKIQGCHLILPVYLDLYQYRDWINANTGL